MSVNININDLDFYSPNIDFVVKGKRKLSSILGTMISFSVYGVFLMFFIQYLIFTVGEKLYEDYVYISDYSQMMNKFSLYSHISNITRLASQKTLKQVVSDPDPDPLILLTTDFSVLTKDFDLNEIYTSYSKYVNGDILLYGFLFIDNNKNEVLSLNLTENTMFEFHVYLEKYLVSRINSTGNPTNNSKNASYIVNSEQALAPKLEYELISQTEIQNYQIVKCSKLFEESLKNTNNSFYNFNYTLTNYPLLNSFECLDNFTVNIPQPKYTVNTVAKLNVSYQYRLNFELDLCNPSSIGCLNSQETDSTLLDKVNNLSITSFTLQRNYKSHNFITYTPKLDTIKLNKNYTMTANAYYKSKYFYNLPLNILSGFDVSPYFSSVDLDTYNISSSKVNITSQNTRPKTVVKIELLIEDNLDTVFFFYNNIINGIGVLGNTLFFLYFVGKVLYQLIHVNRAMDWIMNEIMIIIDPKDKDNVELLERNLNSYKKHQDENSIVVQRNKYMQYQDIALNPNSQSASRVDKTQLHSARGLLVTHHASLVKLNNQLELIKKYQKKGNKKKKEIHKHKMLNKLELDIKKNENLIFNQINRYNLNERFRLFAKDYLANTKYLRDKIKVYEKARSVLFINTNFSNIALSLNSLKFMLVKLIFTDYQYFLTHYLSSQTIIGEYVIGFTLDHFYSRFHERREFFRRLEKFKRAFKKFRKNLKFRKYDKQLLRLYTILTQENLIDNFINQLKDYFNENAKYLDKYGEIDKVNIN